MEEKTIQSIPVKPLALMLGVMGAVVGVFIGIFYALTFGALVSTYLPSSTVEDVSGYGLIFGVMMIVIMPIFGFIAGLIEGVITGLLYNFLAPKIGGIKLRFREENPVPQPLAASTI